jgi:hypothetical protein
MISFYARVLAIIALAVGVTGTSACATIVEGTDQPVTVVTEPSGAVCHLQREGKTVGVVNPTPGTVEIDKSISDITVSCEKEGQLPASGILSSEFQGMTLGNAIIGGVIGVGIDAASGAMNQYPSNIVLHLPPQAFSSAAERDAYFDGRIAEIENDYLTAIEAAENGALCRRDSEGNECTRLKQQIDEAKRLEMDLMERQRQVAIVQSGDGELSAQATGDGSESSGETSSNQTVIISQPEASPEQVETVEPMTADTVETASPQSNAITRPESASSADYGGIGCKSMGTRPECRLTAN